MSDTISIDGTEFELTGNPSLGTVRKVQGMQMDLLLSHIGEDELMEMDSLEEESEIIQAILESGGYSALQDVMWERSNLENLQTLSLAVDKPLDSDTLDEIGAQDYLEYVDSAEDNLGGSASDFFDSLGIGMSMNQKDMKQQAQQAMNDET